VERLRESGEERVWRGAVQRLGRFIRPGGGARWTETCFASYTCTAAIEGENGGAEHGVESWFLCAQREGELQAIMDRKGSFSVATAGVRQAAHDERG
jgi:hypothetical protein